MSRREETEVAQLAFPDLLHLVSGEPVAAPPRVAVPVDPTFDAGQGMREIKMQAQQGSEIAFDWRFLSMAEEYMGGIPDEHEPFVTERGGLVSLATPMNVFRVQGAISRWARDEGITLSFTHIPPESVTAQRLFDALAIEQTAQLLAGKPGGRIDFGKPAAFQSRYVSPVILVDGHSKKAAIEHVVEWIDAVQREGELHFDLLRLIPEVATNLVNHGMSGSFLMCIWPVGEVELLWCNRVRESNLVFAGDGAREVADRISHSASGSGLSYILDELVPRYTGTLCINFNGADIMFHTGRRLDLFHPGRRSLAFTPESVLFTLHLFSVNVRHKGNQHA